MLLDVSLTISPIKDAAGHIVGASKVSRNITDRKDAADKVRRADEGLRLMKAQNQERRHIARELHDTAGQTLTVLGMSLAQLINKLGSRAPDLLKEGQEVEQLVRQLHDEIRTTLTCSIRLCWTRMDCHQPFAGMYRGLPSVAYSI